MGDPGRAGDGPPGPARPEGGGAFDRIAREFDLSRQRPWDFVVEWLEGLDRPAGPVLDVGCGNGRHMLAAREAGLRCLGVDASAPMLATARRRLGAEAPLALGDARALPVRTGAAGAAMAVAVVHHLRSGADREAAVREVARALAPAGRALLSVWALDLPGVREAARAAPEGGPRPRRGQGGSAAPDPRDLLVPWGATPGGRVQRYYRAVPLDELAGLAGAAGLTVLRAGDRGPNHVVEALRMPAGPR